MLSSGTTVAGYEVVRPLGPPSRSGRVYEAIDADANPRLALKVLDNDLTDDDEFRSRFRAEVISQGSLNHPNIVPVYEAGQAQQGLFVAMAKVDGPSLRQLLSETALEPSAALSLLAPVGEALDAAHGAGLVHRNVKPENVLVERDGDAGDHAFLADFGSARPPDGHALIRSGGSAGALNYISPEQAEGGEATARSDVYSLGATLFEALTGSPPYRRDSAKAVLYAHLYRPVPLPSERDRRLPEAIDAVIARAMAKRPEDRYESGGALMAAAADALGTEGQRRRSAGAVVAPPPREAPAPKPDSGNGAGQTLQPAAPPGGAGSPRVTERAPATAVAASTATPPPPPSPTRAPERQAPRPERLREREPVVAEDPPRRIVSVTTETGERRRGPARGLLIGVVGLVVLAAAGAALAFVAPSRESPPQPRVESAGIVGLTAPGDWQRQAAPPRIPGFKVRDPVALAPPGGSGAGLVAGRVQATAPVLLPAAFQRRLADPPQNDDTVALGQVQAYRYAGLAPRGFDGRMNVYAVPTSEGVATVACYAPLDAQEFLAQCERVASTLRLTGARPIPLGPDRRYAARLDQAIGRLNAARAAGGRRLQGARTPAGQARTAAGLSAAYRRAALSLAGAPLNTTEDAANLRIVAALRTTQAAYARMASGARANDRGRYNAARAAVTRGEAAVQQAVEALEPLGYLLT